HRLYLCCPSVCLFIQLRSFPTRRSSDLICVLMAWFVVAGARAEHLAEQQRAWPAGVSLRDLVRPVLQLPAESPVGDALTAAAGRDRKSTRLNSSHAKISSAVFCLKKKTT